MRFRLSSIKTRLVVFFLIATVVPTVILGSISYYISVRVIEEKANKSSVKTLTHIKDNIERQVEALVQLGDAIFVDSSIKKVIQTPYSNDTDFLYDMRRVNEFFNAYYSYSSAGKYVSSVLIFGKNGREIANGDDAYTVPREYIKNLDLFTQAQKANGKIVWTGTHRNWAQIWKDKYVISMARLIKDERQSEGIGTVVISFRESAISDLYENIELGTNGSIFIIDGNGTVISHSREEMLAADLKDSPYIRDILKSNSGFLITEIEGIKMLVSYCTSFKNGWKIIETVPLADLIKETGTIRDTAVILFLSCLFAGALLSWFISEKVSRPIKSLRKTMKKIEEGDLSIRADETSRDEIGQLSHSFNYMIRKMEELFKNVVDEQVRKKDAEYQALLSQINPHFLYNTLNSIKWMAIIQKADSIREMVSALGRLLQKSVKDVDKLVTLEEELSMLKDYIHIQSFRYKDKFNVLYNIQEGCLRYKTTKFMLQPIVENSIFHGLEPKDGLGEIYITVQKREEEIWIFIKDNGVGMTQEQIQIILREENENTRGFSAIGIHNVDQRIKQVFGSQYGLSITSEVGVYTQVEIRLPCVREEDGERVW